MTAARPLIGYRFAAVEFGDTLQRIAARELGDASRWPDLVAINRLLPPFIVHDEAAAAGMDGVLYPGQFLRVPAAVAVADAEQSPDEVFYRDVKLVDGDIQIVNGDFVVVGGRENLRQALAHRLDTDQGELMFHPTYGSRLRRIVGTVNGPTASLLADQFAREAVAADPRISAVSASSAEVSGDRIVVTVEAVPIVGNSVDVQVTA